MKPKNLKAKDFSRATTKNARRIITKRKYSNPAVRKKFLRNYRSGLIRTSDVEYCLRSDSDEGLDEFFSPLTSPVQESPLVEDDSSNFSEFNMAMASTPAAVDTDDNGDDYDTNQYEDQDELVQPSSVYHTPNIPFDLYDDLSDEKEDYDPEFVFETSARDGYNRTAVSATSSTEADVNTSQREPLGFACARTGCIVVVLDHPSTFHFQGKVLLRVVSGAVEILGYVLDKSKKDFVPAYSSDTFGGLSLVTKYAEQKTNIHVMDLEVALKEYLSRKTIKTVFGSFTPTSVVIIMKKHDLAYAVDFACLYIPKAMPDLSKTRAVMLRNKGFCMSNGERSIRISDEHETVGEFISEIIQLHVAAEHPTPCVLIYGKKGLGKSTTLRYLVNKALCVVPEVCYLDADLGQPEFTPPGCVSLTVVSKPLLGPTFTHPKTPKKIAFYGHIQLDSVEKFSACVDKVVDHYKRNYSKIPLFINTMGWIKGLGKDSLNHIRSVIPPNIEVEMVANGGNLNSSFMELREMFTEAIEKFPTQKTFRIPSYAVFDSNIPDSSEDIADYKLNAPTKRDLSILSYFGRMQPYYSPTMTINNFKPLCVRLEDVVLHVIPEVFEKAYLNAVNGSFVALCVVNESHILTSDSIPYNIFNKDCDFSECVGFGFVRAIDVEKNLLFLLTPEPHDRVKKANCLVKGPVTMPEAVFINQDISGVAIPYVKQLSGKKGLLSQKVIG